MHDAEQLEHLPFGVVNDYTNFFHALQNDDHITTIYEKAKAEHVPVVTPNVAHLLESLALMHQPKCVLELGTAFGVSAYHILKSLNSPVTFITVDIVNERQQIASELLAPFRDANNNIVFMNVDFREPDFFKNTAAQYGSFDFVFIDAAKGQYAQLINSLQNFLTPHAVIVLDNIFLNGWIITDAYPNHRQKTAYVRMKNFLQEIRSSTVFSSSLLPLDDGVLVLVKR